jgi:uncharacterized protein
MVKLQRWQWGVLIAPIVLVVVFLLVSAGMQIHQWGLSWIWAIVGLVFVGWRWLLVRWTKPVLGEVEAAMNELADAMPDAVGGGDNCADSKLQRSEAQLTRVLTLAQEDVPIWEDWSQFWSRCLELISAIAAIYAPDAKQPLLNIYVPQAYKLMRGTIDDLDQWMEKLAPVLHRLTIGQAYEGYEVYQKLAASSRSVWQLWEWARWVINPAAAAARTATKGLTTRANQELIGNLSQLLREAILRNLAQQAIALYNPNTTNPAHLPTNSSTPSVQPVPPKPIATPKAETQSLREAIAQAQPADRIAEEPLNLLLIGRTGAGKSSLINTLFTSPKAIVDALPSTDKIQNYQWENAIEGSGSVSDRLHLWDTPGYEQVNGSDLQAQVLTHAKICDALILVTPALDPALQMDLEFLKSLPNLPTIVAVSQVDKLRPIREWTPPYDWRSGDRPKEKSIREAVDYRTALFPKEVQVLPLVTWQDDRTAWGLDEFSRVLMSSLPGAKRDRLARFLISQEAKTVAAASIIDRYCFQMTTTQGLTAFFKTPILNFISTATTGTPALGALLATQVPIEHLPLVLGKIQMAYELFALLKPEVKNNLLAFDLRPLIEPLLDVSEAPDRNAWRFGQTVVEYLIPGK